MPHHHSSSCSSSSASAPSRHQSSPASHHISTAYASESPQVTSAETATILAFATQQLSAGLSGDWVEFGCYRGDTSIALQRLLRSALPDSASTPVIPIATAHHPTHQSTSAPVTNPTSAPTSNLISAPTPPYPTHPQLYLYDSFAGLPPKTSEDASAAGTQFQAGRLDVTKASVILRFKKAGLRVPHIKKAFFADLNPDLDLPLQISFGFLDGDLYQSIKTSLQLCYPRLTPDAVLIVHDYHNPELPGVTLAVDQFLHQHPHVTMSHQHSIAILRFPASTSTSAPDHRQPDTL